MEEANKDWAHYEQIKKMELLPTEWTINDGEMTPKLSLKRKVILNTFKENYDRIYKHSI